MAKSLWISLALNVARPLSKGATLWYPWRRTTYSLYSSIISMQGPCIPIPRTSANVVGVPGCSRNMGQPDILLEIRSWSWHRIRKSQWTNRTCAERHSVTKYWKLLWKVSYRYVPNVQSSGRWHCDEWRKWQTRWTEWNEVQRSVWSLQQKMEIGWNRMKSSKVRVFAVLLRNF